ncbi:MAG: ammonia channel protein [Alphaproteobacteria bacterium RIFCSPHIGHO2_02_FULL_46_13]|nr:MAG: ammonia channel protein [Alphaproteobacteria bacterium RIFCSPHIGHO2_02_FULL_46_13]
MLMATALVLLMTPGVAFFYGGMVPLRSVVSTKLQSFASMGFVTLLWAVCGYSLVFSGDEGGFIGNFDYFMLSGVGMEPNPSYGPTIPHVLFMLFQATFAIITPALITGAVAERVRFKAWLVIMSLWSMMVYVPVAHWVWGPDGWIAKMGGLDFAGGMVVHMTSGYAALVAAVMLGNRKNFRPDEHNSFSALMVLLGGTLLWFGWIGFNAGSALAANGLAAHAAATTILAAAAAMSTWMICDWTVHGRPTAVGSAVGAVAGLVAITPGAGFVSLQSAMFIGVITAVICNYATRLVKNKLKTDDTVDVFACHGIGGTVGAILTAVFASSAVNPAISDGLIYGETKIFFANVIGSMVVIVYTMVMTYIVFKVVGLFMKVRVSEEDEKTGLDATQHGEKAFILR